MSERRNELMVFLGVTFALTYAVEILSLLQGNILGGGFLGGIGPELVAGLQFAMFIPALVAITLNRFVYRRHLYRGKALWFVNYYYILSAEMLVGFVSVSLLRLHTANAEVLTVIGAVTALTSVLGTAMLVVFHLRPRWKEDLKDSKLHFGPLRNYVLFGGFLVVFLTVGAYMDLFFDLGVSPGSDLNTLPVGALNAAVIAPILGITTGVFGEEYGWRIYLQDMLTSMYGGLKGVIMLGVIWGLWHAPVVLAGWTYPGYGVLGLVVFTFLATVLGVLLSYSSMTSGTVMVPAYVHAVNNGYGNFTLYVATMTDPGINFRIGVYGLAILAVLMALLVMRTREAWGLEPQARAAQAVA